MKIKTVVIVFFVLVVAVQWYVPLKMIADSENILAYGTEFKFKTAPVDPSDPFRGKYITLRFEANSFKQDSVSGFSRGENVFVILTTDKDGYAAIRNISKERPEYVDDYLEVVLRGVFYQDGKMLLTINYPFDRFYMEESKAYPAEEIYRKYVSDPDSHTYAIVKVKEGQAVLEDVRINGQSIRELVMEEIGE